MTPATVEAVLAVAEAYVGTEEGDRPNSNPFSVKLGGGPRAWCADFVTVCFLEAGAQLPAIDIAQGFTGCPNAVRYGRLAGELVDRPQRGDVALFDWNHDGVADHTGIIAEVGDGELTTIDGNSGPGTRYVWRMVRSVGTVLAVWRPTVELERKASGTPTEEDEDVFQFPVQPITEGELAGQWTKIRAEAAGHHLRSWNAPWRDVPDGTVDEGLGTFVLDVDAALLAGIGRPLVGSVFVGAIPGGVLVSDDHGDYAFHVGPPS